MLHEVFNSYYEVYGFLLGIFLGLLIKKLYRLWSSDI